MQNKKWVQQEACVNPTRMSYEERMTENQISYSVNNSFNHLKTEPIEDFPSI